MVDVSKTLPMLSSTTFDAMFPVLEIVEGDLTIYGHSSIHDNVTAMGLLTWA